MLRDTLSLTNVLIGFESTLHIDYKEPRVSALVKTTRENLENTYRIKLDQGVYTAQVENRLLGESITALLTQLTENLKSLSLVVCLSMYDKEYGETLRDVNYLGFAKNQCLTALKYLQDVGLYEQRDQFMRTLIERIDAIDMCDIKRLLIVMAVLEDLKIPEGVAIIAQYLYVGGLR